MQLKCQKDKNDLHVNLIKKSQSFTSKKKMFLAKQKNWKPNAKKIYIVTCHRAQPQPMWHKIEKKKLSENETLVERGTRWPRKKRAIRSAVK